MHCLFVSSPFIPVNLIGFFGGKAGTGFVVRCNWPAAACLN